MTRSIDSLNKIRDFDKSYRRLRTGARTWGRKRVHRFTAEAALGRELKSTEVVHHHSDTQLVICENQDYHLLLEARTNILRLGGHPDKHRLCGCCKKLTLFENMTKDRSKWHGFGQNCKPCAVKRTRLYQDRKGKFS